MGAWYIRIVRVVASSTLWNYVRHRVQRSDQWAVGEHLKAWLEAVELAVWNNSAELKASFGAASIVTAERVVFNIKGNDHRLVVAINYQYQIMLVKWIGTHREYDQIDVKSVMYDKERYADSSRSK